MSGSLPPPLAPLASASTPSQLRFRGASSATGSAGSNGATHATRGGAAAIDTSVSSLLHASKNLRSFNDASEADASIVWHDADYALYIELVGGEDSSDDADVAHGIVDAVAVVLRDVGCHVRVFPLQQLDDATPASSKEDTRAYIVTVCSAFLTASPANGSARKAAAAALTKAAPRSTALWADSLPPWITQHAAFKLVSPLSGAARSQHLTRLILKEYRLENDVYLADGTRVFNAHERLLRELLRHDDAVRVHVFPLHRDSERDRLILSWKHQFLLQLPLTDVFQYFGPKLAMYFAWLEFYTGMLVVPAIAGVLVSVLGHFNAISYCVLSFAVSIGTSVFVDYWRRRQRAVEYKWKYQLLMETDAVLDLETRAQFRGEWMTDAVTKQRLYDFPDHKRLARQLLAIPLIVGMCLLVCGYVVALNMLSEHLRGEFPVCYRKNLSYADLVQHGMSTSACVTVTQGPGVLNAAIIQAMDLLYQKLARRLNEYENYRTMAEFEDHLVLKRMPFHFVNSNASLWFLAFYVQDLDRVRDRLWILMVLMQVLDNCKEVGVPFAQSMGARLFTTDGKRRPSVHLNPHFAGFTVELRSLPDRLQRVLTQKRQAHYVDTFSDYKEMMVQYGYVALYTPIFPLAPLFALLNNVIEWRSDFFKLVNSNGFQRPLVQHTHGIGVWENVLVSFSVVAVVVNCAFVWVYEMPLLLPEWSDLHRFMVLVACEHIVFVVKALLNWASPDTPTWIQNEKRIASLSSTHAQLLSPKRKLLHTQHW